MKVIAVIPGFREETRIGETVRGVLTYVAVAVVVDDGSPDQTAERAKEAGAVVLRHRLNRGQGAALKTGTEAALRLGADVVLHVDADGQHDPASIPALLAPISSQEADVVFGSRFLGEAVGIPLSRRLLLAAARTFNALAVGVPRRVTDPQSGFRALTSSAARRIDFHQDRMAHCSEILRLVTRSDLRWREVPVRIRYSEDSLKKGQKPWDAAGIAWQLLLGIFTR
ncbi:glycosyltransferase family 2 protein [Patescibacteria group bacterium]|nr:glycosyltransferase family 2 protein [Patescibacteria group bacterium]MBU2613220.1 glycosyltransferase family 2 protein [Patescibacteria group bacterium]